MFDEVGREVVAFVTSVVPDLGTHLGPPGGPTGVSIYLMELAERPPARALERPPLQIMLHYLVTASLESPNASHRALGRLAFAAMEHPTYEVVFPGLPTNGWSAFGIAPQPSFGLRAPAILPRHEPIAPRVVEHQIRSAPLTSLHGTVELEGFGPLSHAVVSAPELRLTASTDRYGKFKLGAVPASGLSVLVQSRGLRKTFRIENPARDSPVRLQLQPPEE